MFIYWTGHSIVVYVSFANLFNSSILVVTTIIAFINIVALLDTPVRKSMSPKQEHSKITVKIAVKESSSTVLSDIEYRHTLSLLDVEKISVQTKGKSRCANANTFNSGTCRRLTGDEMQVWFQNARAKEKKARLAAGLPAEGSAVQPHRGPTGPDECRLCSVRYSAKTPLQEHVFSRRHIESVRVAVEEGSLVPPTPGAPIVPSGSGAVAVSGIGNSSVVSAVSQQVNQQQQQQQADENMMYGSLFLHPTAMFQSQQQQHPAGAATSTTTTTAGECLADLLDS